MARTLIGKMPREEIAERLGTSLPNLKRAFRGTRLAYHNYCQANPELVRQVAKYFETHTQAETAERFQLRRKQVDHIVNRYKHLRRPKQLRWTDAQIVEAARMAGLVSYKAQARYFNRPGANEGAIHSLWCKRFQMGGGCINGLVHWYAKELVTSQARYLRPIGQDRKGKRVQFRKLILWTDLEKYLKPSVPAFIRDAIKTLADFQRWLHGAKDPRAKIVRMIREREALA